MARFRINLLRGGILMTSGIWSSSLEHSPATAEDAGLHLQG